MYNSLCREFSSPIWKNRPHLKCQFPPKILIWPKSLLYKCSKKWLSPYPLPPTPLHHHHHHHHHYPRGGGANYVNIQILGRWSGVSFNIGPVPILGFRHLISTTSTFLFLSSRNRFGSSTYEQFWAFHLVNLNILFFHYAAF